MHLRVFVAFTIAACRMQSAITRRDTCARESPARAATHDEAMLEFAMIGGDGGTHACLPRHLLIISRYHPGLYDYVRARFATEDKVEVILDRRSGRDRRRAAGGVMTERRATERRSRPHIDAALRMESMQFVTIPPGTICGGGALSTSAGSP